MIKNKKFFLFLLVIILSILFVPVNIEADYDYEELAEDFKEARRKANNIDDDHLEPFDVYTKLEPEWFQELYKEYRDIEPPGNWPNPYTDADYPYNRNFIGHGFKVNFISAGGGIRMNIADIKRDTNITMHSSLNNVVSAAVVTGPYLIIRVSHSNLGLLMYDGTYTDNNNFLVVKDHQFPEYDNKFYEEIKYRAKIKYGSTSALIPWAVSPVNAEMETYYMKMDSTAEGAHDNNLWEEHDHENAYYKYSEGIHKVNVRTGTKQVITQEHDIPSDIGWREHVPYDIDLEETHKRGYTDPDNNLGDTNNLLYFERWKKDHGDPRFEGEKLPHIMVLDTDNRQVTDTGFIGRHPKISNDGNMAFTTYPYYETVYVKTEKPFMPDKETDNMRVIYSDSFSRPTSFRDDNLLAIDVLRQYEESQWDRSTGGQYLNPIFYFPPEDRIVPISELSSRGTIGLIGSYGSAKGIQFGRGTGDTDYLDYVTSNASYLGETGKP